MMTHAEQNKFVQIAHNSIWKELIFNLFHLIYGNAWGRSLGHP